MARRRGSRPRRTPVRTCVGCRATDSKRTLIRVVRTPEGVQIDPSGRLAGRGAYLHANSACWEKGLKGALARSLKITLSAEDRATLVEYQDTLELEEEG